jgi:hypothetical protein
MTDLGLSDSDRACSVCRGVMLGSFEENPNSPTGMSVRWDCPDHPGVPPLHVRTCEHCSGRGYTTEGDR